MKKTSIASTFILTICISCTTANFSKHPKWLCSTKYNCLKHTRLAEPLTEQLIGFYDNSPNDKIYEDFPNEDTAYGNAHYESDTRFGLIRNGYKEGRWSYAIHEYDTVNKKEKIKTLFTEEYFKHGLRDSIFRQFDKDGKITYETTFKMGTGLWKEFHGNGKVYFEAYTKDGYFTDTLHLYNKEGKNFEKRLYQKDVLVYYAGNDWCLKYRYKPTDSTYLEVDSYEVKNLKQGDFRNTFRYKTKEEFEDDSFAKSTLKK